MQRRGPIKRTHRKAINAGEKAHMDRVAALGCCVCLFEKQEWVQPQIHHMKVNPLTGLHLGLGQRASHFHVLPLCPEHHLATSPDGYHASPFTWTTKHGTEIELFREVCRLLQIEDGTR